MKQGIVTVKSPAKYSSSNMFLDRTKQIPANMTALNDLHKCFFLYFGTVTTYNTKSDCEL